MQSNILISLYVHDTNVVDTGIALRMRLKRDKAIETRWKIGGRER
jgi:hypothetical protein